jgi:hypothetical protein
MHAVAAPATARGCEARRDGEHSPPLPRPWGPPVTTAFPPPGTAASAVPMPPPTRTWTLRVEPDDGTPAPAWDTAPAVPHHATIHDVTTVLDRFLRAARHARAARSGATVLAPRIAVRREDVHVLALFLRRSAEEIRVVIDRLQAEAEAEAAATAGRALVPPTDGDGDGDGAVVELWTEGTVLARHDDLRLVVARAGGPAPAPALLWPRTGGRVVEPALTPGVDHGVSGAELPADVFDGLPDALADWDPRVPLTPSDIDEPRSDAAWGRFSVGHDPDSAEAQLQRLFRRRMRRSGP